MTQIIIPNIFFVFVLAVLTFYLTFLTTKGSLTNNTFNKLWDKLTLRGKIVFFVLFTISALLILQEVNNQNSISEKDSKLYQERDYRDSIINNRVRAGVDSLSNQNLSLRRIIDTLNLKSKEQRSKINDLYEQNIHLALQLASSTKKLAYPLPNKFNMIGLSLKIQTDKLKLLIPELNKRIVPNFEYINDIDSVGNFSGFVFPLQDIKNKKEFLDLFEGRELI